MELVAHSWGSFTPPAGGQLSWSRVLCQIHKFTVPAAMSAPRLARFGARGHGEARLQSGRRASRVREEDEVFREQEDANSAGAGAKTRFRRSIARGVVGCGWVFPCTLAELLQVKGSVKYDGVGSSRGTATCLKDFC